MRAFLAVVMPPSIVPSLVDLQRALAIGRAVPAEDLHLTLAFLGEADDAQLEALHDALEARRLPACTLRPLGLASYGGHPPRLVALDIAPEPGLVALHSAVLRAVRGAGIALPRTRFRPHVTLRRFRAGGLSPGGQSDLARALSDLTMPSLPETCATHAALVHSTLAPEGARYETLATYPLS